MRSGCGNDAIIANLPGSSHMPRHALLSWNNHMRCDMRGRSDLRSKSNLSRSGILSGHRNL